MLKVVFNRRGLTADVCDNASDPLRLILLIERDILDQSFSNCFLLLFNNLVLNEYIVCL